MILIVDFFPGLSELFFGIIGIWRPASSWRPVPVPMGGKGIGRRTE